MSRRITRMASAAILMTILCVQAASAQLTVQTGATLITNGAASVTLQNTSLICDGNIIQGADGKFSFAGSGNDSITGAGNPVVDQLEIARSLRAVSSTSIRIPCRCRPMPC